MIHAVVNSLINHVYALLLAVFGWLTEAPTLFDDVLIGAVFLVILVASLWLAFAADQGSHRKPLLRTIPAVITLPKASKPIANDDVVVIRTAVVHHDADTFYPKAEMAAAPERTADDEWLEFLAGAHRSRALHSNADDFAWSDLQWGQDMYDAMAIADAWHEEHGTHCACCHATISTGEHVLIDRGWRIGQDTVEISVRQLEAAGVR